MRARVAALLCAALLDGLSARADMKTYSIGYGLSYLNGTAAGSADGYHLATLVGLPDKDIWSKDGEDLARAPAGDFVPAFSDAQSPALSGDGRLLLHLVRTTDQNGRRGFSAALNGKKIGGVYSEIVFLRVSPGGLNVAYAGHDDAGWSVHSAQGAGPTLPNAPAYLFVSDAETLYVSNWQGRLWMYRNGTPSAAPNYSQMSASSDLKLVGGVYSDPGTGKSWVAVNGTNSGPWNDAQAPVYSDNGRHYAFLARKGDGVQEDTVVVDGAARPVGEGVGFLLIDNAGVPYWTLPSGTASAAYRDGVRIGSFDSPVNRAWAGFSPTGSHYAAWIAGKLVVDGKVAEARAPMPGDGMRIAFDGEKEFHYISNSGALKLVCVTVDGSPAAGSRCAKIGKSIEKSLGSGAEAAPAPRLGEPRLSP